MLAALVLGGLARIHARRGSSACLYSSGVRDAAQLGIMENLPKLQAGKRIEEIRMPTVKGLSDDIYHMLHHSFVGIARMLRSIETAGVAIRSSEKAIAESKELLRQATLETDLRDRR